jgi:hypothetical protein
MCCSVEYGPDPTFGELIIVIFRAASADAIARGI